MKASEINLLKFLRNSTRFAIPIYQRTYSWTQQQCQQLWDDILRTGGRPGDTAHFVGSIVYIQEGVIQIAQQTPFLVIDGQQRLTTVMLILEALARHVGKQEPVAGFSAKKLRQYYLLNDLEEDVRRFKLLLTQTDKATFLSLMKGGPSTPAPADASIRITKNFEFFQEQIKHLGDDLAVFCKGLSSLLIVDIALDRAHDNPQLIFESMNSTGLNLSQADLIRNFVLMGLDHKHQNKLYTEQWRPMEIAFGQAAYGKYFDGFMRHYLTMKTRETPRIGEVYEAFKEYANLPEIVANGMDALLVDVHAYSGYYCAMALGKEKNHELASAFSDLLDFKVGVAFPFLLELYGDYASGHLSVDDFERAVRLVESYVLRRAICEIPTNTLNKTFASFGRVLKKDRYLESIQAHFLSLPSYRHFPSNDEFCEHIMHRNIYALRCSYLLRKLENHGRKAGERVDINECTIEHILPQNKKLSKKWQQDLGSDWQRVQETWLHTLGNLTLTAYNLELSDRPFAYKRDMENGFKESPLHLNRGLGELQAWNESTIQGRAKKLAKKALGVWVYPSVPDSALRNYQPETEQSTDHAIEKTHMQLAPDSAMRPLFDAFRHEVLAFDPNVREEVRKTYIAYKAETNFVDVVPQTNRLQLVINIPFPDVNDPNGMAEDITNRNVWGNGDTLVYFNKTEELRYVIGLVRQAFEKQMGDDESAV